MQELRKDNVVTTETAERIQDYFHQREELNLCATCYKKWRNGHQRATHQGSDN